MRLSVRAVVPLLGAIPLAGAIAGASYALQSSLNQPPPGSTLATVLVTRLGRLGEMRAIEIVPGTSEPCERRARRGITRTICCWERAGESPFEAPG